MIELADVHKVYAEGTLEVHALRGVDLAVEAGELVTIVGPSGSGKSTLLHVLGCLDRATTGTYRFDGRDVGGLSDRELAGVRGQSIGFVFQAFHLLPRETALENVALPLLYAGVRGASARSRGALEAVGLGERLHHRPGQLSGGEQQRVAIARAIVKQPKLILADEPTGNLDSEVGAGVLEVFGELHARGITIVVITHDPEVARMGTRKLQLRDGKLVGTE